MPELEDYFQERKELEHLMISPGWKRLDNALVEMVRVRQIALRSSRMKTLDDAVVKSGDEGVVEGIQLARGYLAEMLADVTANINMLLEMRREEKEHEEVVGSNA